MNAREEIESLLDQMPLDWTEPPVKLSRIRAILAAHDLVPIGEMARKEEQLRAELARKCAQPGVTQCAREWVASHQQRALADLGLAEEFPFGSDAIQHVGEALLAARAELAALKELNRLKSIGVKRIAYLEIPPLAEKASTGCLKEARRMSVNKKERAVVQAEMGPTKRTERGWAGHFILADRCKFRRNTLLEFGDCKIVVSTVGAMMNPDGKYDTVGSGRYFETAAFYAAADDIRYQDADWTHEISIRGQWSISELDADDKANVMHEAAVDDLISRMEAGEL